MKTIKWRFFTVLALTLWALYTAAPTAIYFMQPLEIKNDHEKFLEKVPSWLPKEHVKLGLDLAGGVHLNLGVDTKSTIESHLGEMAVDLKRLSDEKKLGIESAYVKPGSGRLTLVLEESIDVGTLTHAVKQEYSTLSKLSQEDNKVYFGYSDAEKSRIEKSALEQAERVIRSRVQAWGAVEPIINRTATGSVAVQLPGFKNPEKAKELLGRTAQLTFKIVDDAFKGFDAITGQLPDGVTETRHGSQRAFESEDKESLVKFLKEYLPENRELLFQRDSLGDGTQGKYRWTSYVVDAATVFTGKDIQDAMLSGSSDPMKTMPEVVVQMTGPGGARFAEVTAKNINKRMAIVLDGVVESAPVIQSKIPNGRASISLGNKGSYQETVDEGNQLAMVLKSGAIPATIKVLEQREVGASLGPELASKGIKGVLLGLILVLLFMVIYYRRPGVIACIALLLNALFLLAVMASFGFALTLPGIAGFVLTLGMAVDANVLINERIRQEIKEGKNPRKSVGVAFDKVFWTIIDSNVTTLIAALVLMETSGPGPIKGFAVTLMIGLLISLFTALYCSKLFFEIAISRLPDAKVRQWLLGGASEKNKVGSFDFLKFGLPSTVVSIILAVVILIGAAVKGVNLGVDFNGGTVIVTEFAKDVEAEQLRSLSSKVDIESLSVQALDGGKKSYLLRYDEKKTGQVDSGASAEASDTFISFKNTLLTELAEYSPSVQSVDFVGPQVGKELRNQGLLSVLYAILAVLIYIALRFDLRFAPGALIKMFLDIFLLLGFYVFFGASFDLVAIAAFLTVVGYSVNDAIVIFDRIRENMNGHTGLSLKDNINRSLNETLSRTINTSLTTVISLVGILIFSAGDIWYFAMAMAIGVVLATFSSAFIAPSFILWFEKWRAKKAS